MGREHPAAAETGLHPDHPASPFACVRDNVMCQLTAHFCAAVHGHDERSLRFRSLAPSELATRPLGNSGRIQLKYNTECYGTLTSQISPHPAQVSSAGGRWSPRERATQSCGGDESKRRATKTNEEPVTKSQMDGSLLWGYRNEVRILSAMRFVLRSVSIKRTVCGSLRSSISWFWTDCFPLPHAGQKKGGKKSDGSTTNVCLVFVLLDLLQILAGPARCFVPSASHVLPLKRGPTTDSNSTVQTHAPALGYPRNSVLVTAACPRDRGHPGTEYQSRC